MSLQEEELVSSHAGQPEQASSLLDQIMAQTRIQPGSEGYDVARQGVTAFTGITGPKHPCSIAALIIPLPLYMLMAVIRQTNLCSVMKWFRYR